MGTNEDEIQGPEEKSVRCDDERLNVPIVLQSPIHRKLSINENHTVEGGLYLKGKLIGRRVEKELKIQPKESDGRVECASRAETDDFARKLNICLFFVLIRLFSGF